MDDTCAVCAEPFQWVAYGRCGHRAVCSLCVARLRLVCNDLRCTSCDADSTVIFVTRASGKYTRMISDFGILPPNPREGPVGSYWFLESLQAYFDDSDHYKMIKAMCRLSCVICDGMDQKNGKFTANVEFTNTVQLKTHLFREHRLYMCPLCLEGKKVLLCEQKLYKRNQLDRHVETGDLEVDGNEYENGGFTGHPTCEFCAEAFYGSSDLYLHMSVEHYTCHFCLRQDPGLCDYFKDYEALEKHFDAYHFLCENEDCRYEKFIVFLTEEELKRHARIEHGGCMLESEFAPEVHTNIQHCQRDENREVDHCDSPRSSSFEEESDYEYTSEKNANAFWSESSARTRPGLHVWRFFELGEDPSSKPLFPPLPAVLGRNKSAQSHSKNIVDPQSSQAWPAIGHRPIPSSSSSSSSLSVPLKSCVAASSCCYPSYNQSKPIATNRPLRTSYACSVQARPVRYAGSSCNTSDKRKPSNPLPFSFPPLSMTRKWGLSNSSTSSRNVEDLRPVNESVERIRATIGFDEEKYLSFECISAEFREGLTTAREYLAYVQQFGLSHLVPELARLCLDLSKQKELVETYNTMSRSNPLKEATSFTRGNVTYEVDTRKGSLKGQTSCCTDRLHLISKSKEDEADVLLRYGSGASMGKPMPIVGQKNAESSFSTRPSNKIMSLKPQSTTCSSSQIDTSGGEGKKRKKKTKFLKARLGDGSVNALFDLKHSGISDSADSKLDRASTPTGLPVGGVWRNEGGRKLVAMTRGLQTMKV